MLGKKSTATKPDPSKWVSTKNEVFDYSKCQFEVRMQKKVFLGTQTRYVYCTPSTIVIAKEPYEKKPDKIVYLQPSWKVVWIFNPKKAKDPFEKRVTGFRIDMQADKSGTEQSPQLTSEHKIEYYGDSLVMLTMRDFFSKQLFQVKFLDEFEIQKKIGKGKYAKVYKVRRKEDSKYFAVKYLHKNKLATIEDAQAALLNELKILRLVSHVNCLELRATYEDENGYYIITDLLDSEKQIAGELTKHADIKIGYATVRRILSHLLKGIEYVHSLGIMHRDLKPQNIMFAQSDPNAPQSQQEVLKIIDFGLAQFIHDPHYIYVHVGTPGYVAPEILANESDKHRYNSKCDLFSIGVIFHILLTGRSVFPGKKFSQVLASNKECKYDFKGPKYDLLDASAMDLMIRLLDPNPNKRLSATEALQHRFFTTPTLYELATVETQETEIQEQTLHTEEPQHQQLTAMANRPMVQKGFHNLANAKSAKDIDAMEIDFVGMLRQMKTLTPIISLTTQAKHKVEEQQQNHQEHIEDKFQAIFLELVDLFLMLEENQTDDLSFFANPIKPNNNLHNVQIKHTDVLAVVEFDKDDMPEQNNNNNNNNNGGEEEYDEENKQEDNSQTNNNNSNEEDEQQIKQLPKNMLEFLGLFPSQLLEAEMQGDLKKERRLIMRLLARFLVFGWTGSTTSSNPSIPEKFDYSDSHMLSVLHFAKQNMLMNIGLLELIEEMMCVHEDSVVPHFLYLKNIILKYKTSNVRISMQNKNIELELPNEQEQHNNSNNNHQIQK